MTRIEAVVKAPTTSTGMPPAATSRCSTTAPTTPGARPTGSGAPPSCPRRTTDQSPKYRGLLDVAADPPQAPTVGVAVSGSSPTSLPLDSDSLGKGFTGPFTGQTNYWLINVAAAGNYDLSVTTAINPNGAQGYVNGSVRVLLDNQTVVGTYDVGKSGSFSLGSVALKSGLNTLAIQTIHGILDPSNGYNYYYLFQPNALTLTPSSPVTSTPPPPPPPPPPLPVSARARRWSTPTSSTPRWAGTWPTARPSRPGPSPAPPGSPATAPA